MLSERFNFRDLGVYRTEDGRRLRPGLVFRSGSLSGMADSELQQFATFGITRVFDLRSSVERVRSPSGTRSPRLQWVAVTHPCSGTK